MLKNKNKINKFEAGFSLIEMLVVISILVLTTNMLFAMNRNSVANQEVQQVAQQIAAKLRSLQNDALTGKKADDGNGNFVTACLVSFSTSGDDGKYMIDYYHDCSSALQEHIGSDSTIVDLTNSHVKFSPSQFIFRYPFGTPEDVGQITVTSVKNNTIQKNISMNASGNIEITTP